MSLVLVIYQQIFVLISGSEGLLKLWTIKTNECVKTLDMHLDKVLFIKTTKMASNNTIIIIIVIK